MKTISMCNIYTSAVDLAKKIMYLNDNGIRYEINISKGINKEDVVKVTYYLEIEEV